MEENERMLKRSGYSERFSHEIISDAVQGFKNMQQREEAGGQPVDRPRSYDEEGRRRRKRETMVQERAERYKHQRRSHHSSTDARGDPLKRTEKAL